MKILSFDIEEWFHILDNEETQAQNRWQQLESRVQASTDRILQLLDDRSHKATFFCLGWVADKHPGLISRIHAAGHEIATHSFAHKLVFRQDRKDFVEDLNRSIGTLEAITGKRIDTYRAPGFSITRDSLWALDELMKAGIRVDCSVFPASRAHGGINIPDMTPSVIRNGEMKLILLPMNTKNVFGTRLVYSGGGYFRILPRHFLHRWFKNDEYVMTYFHPRDFDHEQPMVPGLGPIRRFKSYVGLKSALNKLDSLLASFEFITVQEAVKRLERDADPLTERNPSNLSRINHTVA